MRRMMDLSDREREVLDKLNEINRKAVGDANQSLWNVCWGYLNGMFDMSVASKGEKAVLDALKPVNAAAPRIRASEGLRVSSDEMYTAVRANSLF